MATDNRALVKTRTGRAKSAKSAMMDELGGIMPKYDAAIAHVAAGQSQRFAAKAAGVDQGNLCKALRTEAGAARFEYWLRQELRTIAPRAVKSLDRHLDSKNAAAAVRAAEAILDRTGITGPLSALSMGNLTVSFDIGIGSPGEPAATIIEHDRS
jgi:hypothetical protein